MANIPTREQAGLLSLLNGESVYTAQAVCKPCRPRCACSDMHCLISRRLLPKTCCCQAFAPTLGAKRPNNPDTIQLLKSRHEAKPRLFCVASKKIACFWHEALFTLFTRRQVSLGKHARICEVRHRIDTTPVSNIVTPSTETSRVRKCRACWIHLKTLLCLNVLEHSGGQRTRRITRQACGSK